ncbi:MAG: hypothetical protein R3E12_18950, partial [Candidatus Eisenbacteria bacterium]
PEPRPSRTDLLEGTNLVGHTFNQFFPWMIREDGREAETLNHVGRHELHVYFSRSLDDDPNLVDFSGNYDDEIENFLQISESPVSPGDYYGIDAPEFYTHASGQVVLLRAAPGDNPDAMSTTYITDRSTSGYTDTPPPEHSGLYRNPLILGDGTLVAVHTPETRADHNDGSRANPISRYDLRIKTLAPVGSVWEADQVLTPGIGKTISYYDPDVLVQYSGDLWELDPVEVWPRPRPLASPVTLPSPEAQIFVEEGVDVGELEQFLRDRDLALLVSRNVTTRDHADEQQPYNLRVPGGTQTQGSPGTMYDVASLQFFQADLIRGIGGTADPDPGRRVLAQPMHDGLNPPYPEGPLGSVEIAIDGSAAAFVPARRALAWQTTDPTGTPVVRERYWLSFQPGEIRSCTSCHGVNQSDQAGNPPPSNPPEALRTLLQFYKQLDPAGVPSGEGVFARNDVALTPAPNPFRDQTQLRFELADAARDARIEIFDARGRRASTLFLGDLPAGEHLATWSGVEDSPAHGDGGSAPPSDPGAGIYFARVALAGKVGPAVRITRLP